MSFKIRNLSVIGYCNGFTLWHYKGTNETLTDIAAPGYFADAGGMMALGDQIQVSASGGGGLLELEADMKTAVLAGMNTWRATP